MRQERTAVWVGALAVLLVSAVSGAQAGSVKQAPAASGHQVAAADAHGSSHGGVPAGGHGGAPWGYGGQNGPEHWGRLSKDYHLCRLGAAQSPIDIGAGAFDGASVNAIDFDYRLSPVELTNTGHTVQVAYAPGSAITLRGQRFELLQFHFHTPSEHALRGQRAPLEAHLVHKSADGELAVIGVMIEEGSANLALSEFWTLLPRQAGETKRDKRILINARDLLPHDTGYYRYMGSLTTPPCSEGVHWYVLAAPVSASAEQIAQIGAVMGANARPVQPTGQRLVLAPPSGR